MGERHHMHRDSEVLSAVVPPHWSEAARSPGAACSQGLVYLKPRLLMQTPGSMCQSPWLGNIIFGCSSLPQSRKYNKIKTN